MDAELTRVRQQGDAENAMSLDDQAASITTGTARTERDMLISIQNGELPRFIARVGPSGNFSRSTFANPTRPFFVDHEETGKRHDSGSMKMVSVSMARRQRLSCPRVLSMPSGTDSMA